MERIDRFVARREPFGFSLYDRQLGEIFVLKDVNNIEDIDVTLKIGDRNVRIAKDEITVLNREVTRSDILTGPTYVEVYPTLVCDERCLFCYMGDSLSSDPSLSMSRKTIDAVANGLQSVGTFLVSILGGEPFLFKDLQHLVTQLVDRKINTAISTNGTVLNPKLFEMLADSGTAINVSMHSHIPEITKAIVRNPKAHQSLMETLGYLIRGGYDPNVSLVVNTLNKNHATETIRFLCDLGIKRFSLYHVQRAGYAQTDEDIGVDFREYVDIVRESKAIAKGYNSRVGCTTNFPFLVDEEMTFNTNAGLSNMLYGTIDGRRALYINYDGTIYPTSYAFGAPTLALGNALTDDMPTLWTTSPILDQFRKPSPPNQCTGCKHLEYCRGGPITNYDIPLLQTLAPRPFSCPLVATLNIE